MNGIINNHSYILSICIPTYNGGNRIRQCLDCIFKAINTNKDIEVIVSDNCSTDNTSEICKEYFNFSNFHYYRNSSNLGFNGNMIRLLDEYSNGTYCWFIGDDDYIDVDSIDIILPIIRQYQIDFLSVGYRSLTPQQYTRLTHKRNRKPEYSILPFYAVVEEAAGIGNVLNTFMTTHIFRLQPIKDFDKNVFLGKAWDNYMQIFPNSYMIALMFANSNNCCYLKTPVLTGVIHRKSYGDSWSNFVEVVFPSYLHFYIEQCHGKVQFTKNHRIIKRLQNRQALLNLISGTRKKWVLRVLSSFSFYIDAMQWIVEFLFRRMK